MEVNPLWDIEGKLRLARIKVNALEDPSAIHLSESAVAVSCLAAFKLNDVLIF